MNVGELYRTKNNAILTFGDTVYSKVKIVKYDQSSITYSTEYPVYEITVRPDEFFRYFEKWPI